VDESSVKSPNSTKPDSFACSNKREEKRKITLMKAISAERVELEARASIAIIDLSGRLGEAKRFSAFMVVWCVGVGEEENVKKHFSGLL
jgi:hypothetical protein